MDLAQGKISLEQYLREVELEVRGRISNSDFHCNTDNPTNPNRVEEGRKLLGILAWCAKLSPRASFYLSALASQHGNHPCDKSVTAIKRALLDVKSNHHLLMIPKNFHEWRIFTDASFERVNCSGRSGVLLTWNDGEQDFPVAWQSRKINRKVISAYAAEVQAMIEGLRMWLKWSRVARVMFPQGRVTLLVDNQPLYHSLKGEGRIKEVFSDQLIEFGREVISEEKIEVQWVQRQFQLADRLTHF